MAKKEITFSDEDVKALIKLFNQFQVDELNIENNGLKIELKRNLTQEMLSLAVPQVLPEIVQVTPSNVDNTKSTDKEDTDDKYEKVASPMVGTFYRSSSPNAEPFVREGDYISPENTICIIEAMKMMNEIKPEIHGKIVKIVVENGEPVQAGQALFLIEND